MANYATLKAAIAAVIKENGNNEITGNLLQQSLLAMVDSLGVGWQYVGIATPATNPGIPDQNVFYLASTAGTYVNFSGLVLANGEIAILKYNGAWSKDSTGAATQESINQLDQKENTISAKTNGLSVKIDVVANTNKVVEIPIYISNSEKFNILFSDKDNIISDGYTRLVFIYSDNTRSEIKYPARNTTIYYSESLDIKAIEIAILSQGITTNGSTLININIPSVLDNEIFTLRADEGRWTKSDFYESGRNNSSVIDIAIKEGTSFIFEFKSDVITDGYTVLYAIYKETNSATQLRYVNSRQKYIFTAADDIKSLRITTFSAGIIQPGKIEIKVINIGTNGEFLENVADNVEELKSIVKQRYTFSNGVGCRNEINAHIEQLDSSGEITENYGAPGNVTVVNLGNIQNKKAYVAFKFRINENINVPTPNSMDISKTDADLLNIFEYIGKYKKRVGIIPKEFTQSTISSDKYASLSGQALYASCWNIRTKQDYNTFDGWNYKLMTGKRVLSIRYVGADYEDYADDLFVSNDGINLSIYSVSNATPINKTWTLANYATNSELITALKNDSDIEVQVFNSYQSTPAQLATFSGICIINTRDNVINNDDFYIPTAVNEDWHIFEWMYEPENPNYSRPIIQIDGVGFYERDLARSDIFDSNNFKVFIGGSESGSNIDISYKDIDVRIVDTLDAELLVNSISGYTICSNLSPRVMIYTMHDIQNSNVADGTYSTNIDRLYWFFNLAKTKGYSFVSINDICDFIKGNKTLPKRSILTINDDWREYIFLNRNIRAAFSDFGAKLTLALHTIPDEYSWDEATKTFNYQGTGSSVRELVQNIRACGFDVIFHAKNDDVDGTSVNTVSAWDIWKTSFDQAEKIMIDDTIHVYVGGGTTPFHCEHIKTEGVKIALTTNKGFVTKATYEMRIPRYYIDQVESTSLILSELI